MSPRTRRIPVADFTHSAAYVRAQAEKYKITFDAFPAEVHESWATDELTLPDTPCYACRLPPSRVDFETTTRGSTPVQQRDDASLAVWETFAQTRIPLAHPSPPEDALLEVDNEEAYEATAFVVPILDDDVDWVDVPPTPRLGSGEWGSASETTSSWDSFGSDVPPTPRVDAGEWVWEDVPTPRVEQISYFVCNPDEPEDDEDDVEYMTVSTPRI
ncbi:hypothetical protein AURDEDRAFT_167035 [Auricularia subglabra TFB-10046 SS5]|nr:hypothetical protein AURDEDRAFT_167035 [Auricularia subglabra TFB-10046 SS5]